MIKGLMLLMLAAVLFPACAETNSYRSRNPFIDDANSCAVCGGSVQDNYFAGSNFRAIGPGNY